MDRPDLNYIESLLQLARSYGVTSFKISDLAVVLEPTHEADFVDKPRLPANEIRFSEEGK